MDSQQTSRAPEDLVAERASPRVKQIQPPLPSGLGPQAYSAGGGSRPPGTIAQPVPPFPRHRPEQTRPPLAQSGVGSPSVAGQASRQPPPFGQARPLDPYQAANSPQVRRAAPRFHPPIPGPTVGLRPQANEFPGPITPARSADQQRIRERPRNGAESLGNGSGGASARPFVSSQFSSPAWQSHPPNPEIRRGPAPAAVPRTFSTAASPRDDRASSVTREPRTNEDRSGADSVPATTRPRNTDDMQVAENGSSGIPVGSVGSSEARLERETDARASARRLADRPGNDRGNKDDNDGDDDDDDDVVVDEDAESKSLPREADSPVSTIDASTRGKSARSTDSMPPPPPPPPPQRNDRPASTTNTVINEPGPGSSNLEVNSAAPSPSRTGELPDPAKSATLEPGTNTSVKASTPVPTSPSPRTENAARPAPAADSTVRFAGKSEETPKVTAELPIPPSDDSASSSRSESRRSERGADLAGHKDGRSVDNERGAEIEEIGASSSPPSSSPAATLAVPRSPSTASSPRSRSVTPSSPLESVKGFDEGEPRSLSPMPPGRSGEAGAVEAERKRATIAGGGDASPEEDRADRRPSSGELAPERTHPQGREASSPVEPSGRTIESDADNSESGGGKAADGAGRPVPTSNGVAVSPTKKASSTKQSRDESKRTTASAVAGSPVKSPSKSIKSLPRTPEAAPPSTAEKKIPMNKVQVGAAPSPNLKTVRSKIGSLENASYKPGGGKVKIENRKLDFSKAQPKIAAKNDKYTPSGGDKKITQVKLQWNAKPKVGSLDNATYKPGGGDKKIETVKLDFKDKAKPKVGSKENAKHVPGGGTVKSSSTPPKTPQDPPNEIETQKIDIKAESKIGSLDNVKHKPGGGDRKIFNDKDYLRQQQIGSNVESLNGSGAQSPVPSGTIDERKGNRPTSDENLNEES